MKLYDVLLETLTSSVQDHELLTERCEGLLILVLLSSSCSVYFQDLPHRSTVQRSTVGMHSFEQKLFMA